MRSSVNEGCQSCAATDVEDTNAFGGVNLVSRKRQEVHTEFLDVHFQFTDRLHSIGMKRDLVFLCDLAYLFKRLDGAILVIDVHDRDQDCCVADCLTKLLNTNLSVSVYREIGYLETALLQILTGMQDGVMLHRGGEDMVSLASALL